MHPQLLKQTSALLAVTDPDPVCLVEVRGAPDERLEMLHQDYQVLQSALFEAVVASRLTLLDMNIALLHAQALHDTARTVVRLCARRMTIP